MKGPVLGYGNEAITTVTSCSMRITNSLDCACAIVKLFCRAEIFKKVMTGDFWVEV